MVIIVSPFSFYLKPRTNLPIREVYLRWRERCQAETRLQRRPPTLLAYVGSQGFDDPQFASK